MHTNTEKETYKIRTDSNIKAQITIDEHRITVVVNVIRAVHTYSRIYQLHRKFFF